MALLSSQPVSLPTALPSPTLTNPDMILPYRSSSLSASPVAQRLPQQFFTSARLDSRQGATHHRNDSLEGSMQKLFGNSGRLDHSRARVDHKVRQKSRERLFLTPSPTPDDEPDYTRVGDFHHPKIIDGHWQGFDGPSEDVVVQFHDNEPQRSVEVKVAPRKIRPAPVNGTQEIRAILDEDENDPHSHAAMSRRAENILANAKKRLLTMENNLSRARHSLNARPSSSMSSFGSHNPGSTTLETVQEHKEPSSHLHSIRRHPNSPGAMGSSKGHTRVFSETYVSSSLHSRAELDGPGKRNSEESRAFALTSENSPQVQPAEAQVVDASRKRFRTGSPRDGDNSVRLHQLLEPLHEDKPAPASFGSSPFTSNSSSTVNQDSLVSVSALSDPSSSYRALSQASTLTRARSTVQMRDLRDQMLDLKGKISNLKQKAREDGLRRRSLQSLRTPSPFTAAEQWHNGTSVNSSAHQNAVTESINTADSTRVEEADETNEYSLEPDHSGIHGPGLDHQYESEDGENDCRPHVTKKELDTIHSLQQDSPDSCLIFRNSVDGERKLPKATCRVIEEPKMSDPYNGDDCPEGRHLNDDQDARIQNIQPDARLQETHHHMTISLVDERHEDRPDAFDYEHFFLHSGIGFESKAEISRTSSHSSMYSEETTKAAHNAIEEQSTNDECSECTSSEGIPASSECRSNIHLRQNSGGSISTVATFATATEGREMEDESGEDGWILRRQMTSNWPPKNPPKESLKRNRRDVHRVPGMKQAHEVRLATDIKQPPGTTYPVRSSSLTPPTQFSFHASPSSSLELLPTLSASTPAQEGIPATTLQLRNGDKDLVERLIRSLFNVCVQLHTGSIEGEKYDNKLWRRRLDAARRVLDGDINGEAF